LITDFKKRRFSVKRRSLRISLICIGKFLSNFSDLVGGIMSHPKKSSRSLLGKNSGQILIVTAALLVVLIAFLGLATDVGYLRFMKRESQKAADAGAIAGASEVLHGGNVTATARYDTALNGFTQGKNGVNVEVNNPPLSGPNTGKAAYVEVIVHQTDVPLLFMKIGGQNLGTVSSRAVAALTSGTNCVYALRPDSVGIKMSPGGGYEVEINCGVIVNSDTTNSAVNPNGNTLRASSLGIRDPGSCSQCEDYYNFQNLIPDPLAYVPTPTPTGACLPNPNITAPGNYTLPAGNYCSGITIGTTSGNQPDVTLHGTYYITGGTLLVNSPKTDNEDTTRNAHVNLHGDDVLIYLDSDAKVSMGGGNGKFVNSFDGLNAATSGEYAGILFFQDRATPYYKANVSSGQGNGFTGALYFPSVNLRYNNSNPSAALYLIIVAWDIELYRDMATVAHINSDYSSLENGSPIHSISLVE